MWLALTGDVMLGRLVDQFVLGSRDHPAGTVWGDVLPLLRQFDARLVNLECVISERGTPWRPASKPFHFRARPRAIEALREAGIDGVSLANNHVFDFGPEALVDYLRHLDGAHIAHAGAGLSLDQALAPMVLSHLPVPIAVVSLTDNEPDWEAKPDQPGVNFVRYGPGGLQEPYRSRLAGALARARSTASVVLVSAHVGPNWGEPSGDMQAMAHELVDMGADLYWGHSNHSPQGIELYRGRPILYSTGDFVDDYAVDPDERNDLSFLFGVELRGNAVERLTLYPTAIEDFRVRMATPAEAAVLRESLTAKCRAFGTPVDFQTGMGVVQLHD